MKSAKNAEIEILFNQIIKMAYENAGGLKRYVYSSLLSDTDLAEKFKMAFFTRLKGSIELSETGKHMKEKIDSELTRIKSEFPLLIQNDIARALEILKRIGGNVFLISTLDFELLKEIDEELAKAHQNSRDHTGGCGGCYTTYGHNSDSFDGAFDSADSPGGGSGCSGDSGCSGCSGCGGCGGCGGCS